LGAVRTARDDESLKTTVILTETYARLVSAHTETSSRLAVVLKNMSHFRSCGPRRQQKQGDYIGTFEQTSKHFLLLFVSVSISPLSHAPVTTAQS